MTIHLTRFVDRVRAQESRAAKDFVMSMADAKDLHADIPSLAGTACLTRRTQTQRSKPGNTSQNDRRILLKLTIFLINKI
jgi:hypothetical protein